MSEKISINLDELIRLYNDNLSTMELAEHFNVGERTISRRLWVLRRDKKISTSTREKYVNEKLQISKQELLKLLTLCGTKAIVAKRLDTSTKIISNFCDYYKIIDNKSMSENLNKILKELIKDYKPFVIKSNNHGAGETLVIGISDWHVGKTVKDSSGKILYDMNVFAARINKLLKAMLKLIDSHIAKHVVITDIVILCTGDMANGEGIYPTQVYDQSDAPPKQVMTAVKYMMKLILSLLKRNIPVKFYGCLGNHGMTGKNFDPISNWDIMIYMILKYTKETLKLKNLEINYSESDYMLVNIRKWKYLLRHKAYAQDETAAGQAKYLGWQKIHDADVIVSGHVHHWSVNGRRIVIGSTVGQDDLSERMAKAEGEPSQLLWLSTDERSHTNIYAVDLKSRDNNERN